MLILKAASHRGTDGRGGDRRMKIALRPGSAAMVVRLAGSSGLKRTIRHDVERLQIGLTGSHLGDVDVASNGVVKTEFDDAQYQEYGQSFPPSEPTLRETYLIVLGLIQADVIATDGSRRSARSAGQRLNETRIQDWGIATGVETLLVAGLHIAVAAGSNLVEQHFRKLDDKVRHLAVLVRQNRKQQQRGGNFFRHSAKNVEPCFSRVGFCLIVDTWQMIAIAMQMSNGQSCGHHKRSSECVSAKFLLYEATSESNDMETGLALPEIGSLSLRATLTLSDSRHRKRTGAQVSSVCCGDDMGMTGCSKFSSAYFIQDALDDAFRHADCKDNAPGRRIAKGVVLIRISDHGPSVVARRSTARRRRLSLVGLRNGRKSLGRILAIFDGKGKDAGVTISFYPNCLYGP